MARRRHFRYFPPKRPSKKAPPTAFLLLDRFSIDDIKKWAAFKDQILKFHWDYYNDLAYQRSKIADKIRKALLDAAEKKFKFSAWQRAIKYKYSLNPLSVRGSTIDPGGRFNIGDFNPSQYSPFPAFYLACDKDTAIQELLSQKIDPHPQDPKLSPLDLALTNQAAISLISLSGSLESVINLKEPSKLQPFVDLIKDFDLSDELKKTARAIGLPEPLLIRTVPDLVDALLAPNWREWPMQFDVPVSSQIFGRLVTEAGIDGILYPSKFTDKDCLVIFPQNFDDASESFIGLDGDLPPGVEIRRLDAKTRNKVNT